MCKQIATRPALAVVALLLAGCGGSSGSDGTAVSGSPAAPPPPVAAAPAPPPPPPAPVPVPAPAPPAAAPAPAPTIPGSVVWAALQAGISPDPNPSEPVTNYRKVTTADGFFLYLGGNAEALESHSFTTSPWGSLMREGLVTVSSTGSNGVIETVSANNLALAGPPLDLRKVDPAIDTTVATWRNGEWSASLLVQSTESPQRVRICWNVHLPPPPPVTGPPGTSPVVYSVPLKRLMCGVHGKAQPGPDLGGYVVDDFKGTIRTFQGTWPG